MEQILRITFLKIMKSGLCLTKYFWMLPTVVGFSLPAQDTLIRLPEAQYNDIPFRYVGMIQSSQGFGSASLVADSVYISAAHVIWDDDNLVWGSARWQPRRAIQVPGRPSESFFTTGTVRWDEYADRATNDGAADGQSTLNTFNLDLAATYWKRSRFLDTDEVPASWVDEPNTVSILRYERPLRLVGYPTEPAGIPVSDRGFMHTAFGENWDVFWTAFNSEPETWFDSDGYWVHLYNLPGVEVFGGASGGPTYQLQPNGEWLFAGVLVGGTDEPSTLLRGIDAAGWELVEEAARLSGRDNVYRPTGLTAQAGGGGVALSWSYPDNEREAQRNPLGWRIYRANSSGWELRGESMEGTLRNWTDTAVLPGMTYVYRLEAIGEGTNRSPFSAPATATMPGHAGQVAAALGEPWLTWQTEGPALPLVQAGAVQTGDIHAMEGVGFSTDVIGPGTVRFRWSVSSEKSDAPEVGSSGFDDVYDTFFFSVNGQERLYISGEVANREETFAVPAGPAALSWEYRKDPSTSAGQDAGTLHSVVWEPANGQIVRGAWQVDEVYRATHWWGAFTSNQLPWTFHWDWGWLYLVDGPGETFWAVSSLPDFGWILIDPAIYPIVYLADRQTYALAYPGASQGQNLWVFDYTVGDFVLLNASE